VNERREGEILILLARLQVLNREVLSNGGLGSNGEGGAKEERGGGNQNLNS
jgi:hypothetical protein